MRALLVSLLLTATTVAWAQDKPQDQYQTVESCRVKIRDDCRYLLSLPQDYNTKTKERWPLMLFLHGAGERGTNVWRADIHGPAKYLAAHRDLPFILVSPICASNQSWSTPVLEKLLDSVMAKLRVDPKRVYLTGLSMGGFGTWDLAFAEPGRFAAVAPICGGGKDLPVILANGGFDGKDRQEALKSLPVWAFHGAKDTVVKPAESERMVEALRHFGATEVKLTIYPDATHNAWDRTYANPDFYAWLLQHHR